LSVLSFTLDWFSAAFSGGATLVLLISPKQNGTTR